MSFRDPSPEVVSLPIQTSPPSIRRQLHGQPPLQKILHYEEDQPIVSVILLIVKLVDCRFHGGGHLLTTCEMRIKPLEIFTEVAANLCVPSDAQKSCWIEATRVWLVALAVGARVSFHVHG